MSPVIESLRSHPGTASAKSFGNSTSADRYHSPKMHQRRTSRRSSNTDFCPKALGITQVRPTDEQKAHHQRAILAITASATSHPTDTDEKKPAKNAGFFMTARRLHRIFSNQNL
jgi:hypothetical protein